MDDFPFAGDQAVNFGRVPKGCSFPNQVGVEIADFVGADFASAAGSPAAIALWRLPPA
jgi:hypothetical protein